MAQYVTVSWDFLLRNKGQDTRCFVLREVIVLCNTGLKE
jgi:hypothetical protein